MTPPQGMSAEEWADEVANTCEKVITRGGMKGTEVEWLRVLILDAITKSVAAARADERVKVRSDPTFICHKCSKLFTISDAVIRNQFKTGDGKSVSVIVPSTSPCCRSEMTQLEWLPVGFEAKLAEEGKS